jgi:hypothetical protein
MELVKTKDVDGNDLELGVFKPNYKISQEANLVYNLYFSKLLKEYAKRGEKPMLRAEVDQYLKDAGIWTNKEDEKIQSLVSQIRSKELKLKKGGIKKSEGRQLALEINDLRTEMIKLYAKKQQLDSSTIESMCENHKFNFLVSQCVVFPETKENYFKDFDDYLDRADEVASIDCAKKLAELIYNISSNLNLSFYESEWLKKAGFINEDGKFVDENGSFIDKTGRKINIDGRFIDEDGNLVDRDGNKVDSLGNLIIDDSKPFIDDKTGKEVII